MDLNLFSRPTRLYKKVEAGMTGMKSSVRKFRIYSCVSGVFAVPEPRTIFIRGTARMIHWVSDNATMFGPDHVTLHFVYDNKTGALVMKSTGYIHKEKAC